MWNQVVLFFNKTILSFTWKDFYLSSPLMLLYIAGTSAFVGWLRTKEHVITPYTRKVFHFMIFSMAGLLQMWIGLGAVALFGIWTSMVVLYAVLKGRGFAFYESIARPKDAPHQSFFILVPLASTILGGVISNLFFPKYAFIGYLVAGWADAIAEPVGTRWGKHRYKVPSLFGVKATRSLEGSLAVFLTGFAAVMFCGWILNLDIGRMLAVGLLCSLTAAAVEAVSHHGLDNLTVQVVVSAVAAFVLG